MQRNGERPALDYLEALKARDLQVEVTLGGKKTTVRRARLGLALRLFDLQERATDAIELALPYVAMAADMDSEEIGIEEVGYAFRDIYEMNKPVGVAALAVASTGPGKEPPAFRYRGRGAAAFVHEIAHAYGWTADYILESLTPEEAWCYVQEIENARHEERKVAYTLSTVGRDKRGHQKPLGDPAWFMLGYERPRPRRHPGRRAARPPPRPTGTVYDLTKPLPRRTK